METNTNLFTEILNKIRWNYTKLSSEEIADMIGTLDRDAYLGLRDDWKAAYKDITKQIRDARALRKTGNEQGSKYYWMSHRQFLRFDARRLMALRSAIKVLGRRHWEAKQALAA